MVYEYGYDKINSLQPELVNWYQFIVLWLGMKGASLKISVIHKHFVKHDCIKNVMYVQQ